MSARSIQDIRPITLNSPAANHAGPQAVPGPPNGPMASAPNPQHGLYVQRHPINARHPVAGSALHPIRAVDGSPAKGLHGGSGLPAHTAVSLASAGLGRSVSPAQVAAAANMIRGPYPGYGGPLPAASLSSHRPVAGQVPPPQSSADLRYVQQQYQTVAAGAPPGSSGSVQVTLGQPYHSTRDPGANVYVRNLNERAPSSVADLRGVPSVASGVTSASGRPSFPTSAPGQNMYRPMREMMTPEMLQTWMAPAPGRSAASNSAPGGQGQQEVQPMPERPRIDPGLQGPHQGPPGQPPALAPLRIDTSDSAKDAGYHPKVEAISPTGPDAGCVMEDMRFESRKEKDNLLQKITKVDRDIAKAESQIAKLKKKQQELEDKARKPLSDAKEEEEKPRNQSKAQEVYAENRKKAEASHAMLERFNPMHEGGKYGPVCELPLYNQPSDTFFYHNNKRSHAIIKPMLVERFKKRNEEKEARERYMTETYAKLLAQWQKKVDKLENSKKRKEREARARELYEKNFPELRKQREDKERDHRLGSRGTVRSEAEVEDVIERIQEQEMEDKKMHSYAVIPPLLLPPDERRRKFTNNNGLILDPLREYEERKFVNTWTDAEKEIFKEKFLLHPKSFGQIAQFLDRKTVSDCVQYYYLSKKTENYKQLLKRPTKTRPRGGRRGGGSSAASAASAPQDVMGVVTRNRRNDEKNNANNENGNAAATAAAAAAAAAAASAAVAVEEGTLNRGTHGVKAEIKEEQKDDEDKKHIKKEQRNDSSDDEDGPQQVKSGPHPCHVCKATVEQSRAVTHKSLAVLLGLKEDEVGHDVRACNGCYLKAQRKRHCPIPCCTSTKGRGKGSRLRHMPGKWAELPKDVRDVIHREFQIPEGTKKCCQACFNKINRKTGQLLGANENHKAVHPAAETNDDASWPEDEVEILKTGLRSGGKNWAAIAELLGAKKTRDQCKKFFYNFRKKHQLDKIVLEYKRANQKGDQPPTLSTDEESGSSTSSCDEDGGLVHNQHSGPSSGRNSPAARRDKKGDLAVHAAVKAEVKEEVKTEIKMEDGRSGGPAVAAPRQVSLVKEEEYDSSATMSADEGTSSEMPKSVVPAVTTNVGSLTISASALGPRGEPNVVYRHAAPPAVSGTGAPPRPGHPSGHPLDVSLRTRPGLPPPGANTMMRPPTTIPPMQANLPSKPTQQKTVTNGPNPSGQRDSVITVKELMINVIEGSLSSSVGAGVPGPPAPNGNGTAGVPPAAHGAGPQGNGAIPPPTIHNLLENSNPGYKTNFQRHQPVKPSGGAVIQQVPGSAGIRQPMAPPSGRPSARPPPLVANTNSTDCEGTLDLSMPRKRDATPPPQMHTTTQQPYREPMPGMHPGRQPRSSPAPPPPAHSGNKVSTNPDLFISRADGRQIPSPAGSYGSSDGRHLTTPPHHNSQSPRPPGMPAPRMGYAPSRQGLPPPSAHMSKHPSMSPKLEPKRNPLTVQTGSITQGTPMSHGQHPQSSRYHDTLLKVDPKAPTGSITHGTPVYDKKHQVTLADKSGYDRSSADFYRRSPSTSPYYASGASQRPASYSGVSAEPHMSSRQVIINDYAMARSTEMQRRPDSRDYRGAGGPAQISPRGRDPSPRPRQMVVTTDHRAPPQLDIRRSDGRYERVDPRMLADPKLLEQHHADPRATLHEVRGDPRLDMGRGDQRIGLEIRPDPRTGMDPRADLRQDMRMAHDHRDRDPRIIDPRAFDEARRQGYYGVGQQIYISHPSSSGRRTPPRSASPSRNMIVTSQQRPGLTSGKPVMTKAGVPAGVVTAIPHREVEIYRTNPEVTISKTNSPRQPQPYNEQSNPLDSLVNVAIQQPKLPDKAAAHVGSSSLHYQGRAQPGHPGFERSRYPDAHEVEKARAAAAAGTYGFSSGPHDPNQLVQQVQAERSKQQYFILQGDRAVSSAARLTTPAERAKVVTQVPRPTTASLTMSTSSSKDSPAVIVNERPGNLLSVARIPNEPRKVSASSLINAVITQQINSGAIGESSHPGGPLPANAAALNASMAKQFRKSPSMGEEKTSSSPFKVTSRSPSVKSDGVNGPDDHAGSRPGSRSSCSDPQRPVMNEQVEQMLGKDLQIQPTSAPTTASVSVASAEYWKRRGFTGDMARVVPVPSTATSTSAPVTTAKPPMPMPRLEPISPDVKGRPPPPTPGIDKGISDYVKNKIVEEMKKSDGSSGGNASTAPSKRPAEELQNDGESPRKKLKDDESMMPDSPGSPGEMVIDESVRPDSVPSQKASSPAPPSMSATTTATTTTSSPRLAPAATAPITAPRYEPLSDDE